MKTVNIFGVQGKMWFLGKVYKKTIYRGDCLKRGACTVCRFKDLARKREGLLLISKGNA